MSFLKKYHPVCLGIITLLCAISWIIQSQFLLNWDVSWDILVTQRLINGGSYTQDFFDLNPPLVFYVYTPSVFLAYLFSIPTTVAFRLYLFTLALFSMWLCNTLIRRIFIKERPLIADALLVSVTITFFLLPGMDFGEREHLLVLFTLPYFLAVGYQLQNNSLNRGYAIAVGFFAFMGFALKPYFLLPLAFVELFSIFYTRDLKSWIRPEVITLLILLTAYVAVIFIFYPDYVATVVPLGTRFYYMGFGEPWREVLKTTLVFFCGMAGLCYALYYIVNDYKALSTVLMLAMTGFLTAYFIQQTSWDYHIYPAIAMAFLIMSMSFALIVSKYIHNAACLALLAAAFFSIPLCYLEGKYSVGIEYKEAQPVLKKFLVTHAYHRPVYFITSSPREIFPTVMNAHSYYASRLLHFFWIPAIVKDRSRHAPLLASKKVKENEQSFINIVAEDIETKKAKFIFVDIKEHKSFFLSHSFDYLPYLLKNKRFQTAFKPYHYFTTIESLNNTFSLKDWLYYWAKNKQTIPLKSMNKDTIVFTREKGEVFAYYMRKHQFLKGDGLYLMTKISLTQHEQSKLPSTDGYLSITGENNNSIIQKITAAALRFPVYKFAVYARQEQTLKATS